MAQNNRGGQMLRIVGTVCGLALLHLSTGPSSAADRDLGVAPSRAVYKHHYRQRVVRYGCPEGYGCYPLYGAYGPYGGRAFWSSFSYLVPPAAPPDVIY